MGTRARVVRATTDMGLSPSSWAAWRRVGRGLLVLAALLCASPQPARACLWDRDTLAAEARDAPDVVEVVTGRFERNPPQYYEFRVERIEASWRRAPQEVPLAELDDAAVACDRLGRSGDALAWMRRKRARLDMTPAGDERANHEYRYHANLGTLLAHRWIRRGAKRDDPGELQDLVEGRRHIARAIELNPDAHFGRERYQLLAMDWLLDPPRDKPALSATRLPTIFAARDVAGADWRSEYDDAVEGLLGLIRLGAAWRSIDIHAALHEALNHERHYNLSYLVNLRLLELHESGQRTLYRPLAPYYYPGEEASIERVELALLPGAAEAIEAFYADARVAAERWHAQRLEYMERQFERGLHPDTDPDFWSDFEASAPPELPGAGALAVELAQQREREHREALEHGATRARWRAAVEPDEPPPRPVALGVPLLFLAIGCGLTIAMRARG